MTTDSTPELPAEDAYRVRVWATRRWTLFGHEFGRRVWVVEIDSLSDWPESGDQMVERHWLKAKDAGALVVYVGPTAVVDERVTV